jgi:hypothetical protein
MSASRNSPASKGFDEELAEELQSRAQEALERREAAAREERRGLGVEDALADMPHLTEAMLVTLGKAGIKTLDDLADLATDELIAKKRASDRRKNREAAEDKGGVLAEYGLSEEQGNEIIMAARAHWIQRQGRSQMLRKLPNEALTADRVQSYARAPAKAGAQAESCLRMFWVPACAGTRRQRTEALS